MKITATKNDLIRLGFEFDGLPLYDNDDLFIIEEIDGYDTGKFTVYDFVTIDELETAIKILKKEM